MTAPETSSGGASGQSGSPDLDATADGPAEPPETSTSAPPDSAGDVSPVCSAGAAIGTLPFAVDSQFAPTGAFGDMTPAESTSSACPSRASATAKGLCHTVTYTPHANGMFLGVFWQDNFNWGTQGGYAIPQGATKVTFSAKGMAGGEKVSFIAGYTGAATSTTPCTDTVHANSNALSLTTTWTTYTMTLSGSYPNGVLGAFGWEANEPAGTTGAAQPAVTFYVDNILYQ
jgi:hypothetical protein